MFTDLELVEQSSNLERFARKLTRNTHDADDLLQTTLLRAIEKRHLFQARSNLFSWTSKIMFNLFVTNYRQTTRFTTQFDPDWYIERETVEPNQEVNTALEETFRAMLQLSPEHREILELVCVKGLHYQEVSDHLKIPVGTVRSRLSRAREWLQKAMEATPRASLIPTVGHRAPRAMHQPEAYRHSGLQV